MISIKILLLLDNNATLTVAYLIIKIENEIR